MKLQIDEIPLLDEVEIIIRCNKIDEKINKISNYIRTSYITIKGKVNNETYMISLDDIYYFEAVENKVFAYVTKNVYEVNYKIQELIDMLRNTSFTQVTRTIILNVNKIERVSTIVNGRICAVLDNQEKLIITRAYARDFKEKIRG